MNNDFTVKEDMICPISKQHCDDECCPVGAECNISGNQICEPERDNDIDVEEKRKDFCLWYYAQSKPLDANKVFEYFNSHSA